MSEGYGAICMCALDFARALHERNRAFKFLFRLVVGKYAYREYELLIKNFYVIGYDPTFSYDLEGAEYHITWNDDYCFECKNHTKYGDSEHKGHVTLSSTNPELFGDSDE